MSSRYDPAPPPEPSDPFLLQKPPMSRAKLIGIVAVALITAAVGIGAAFGLDFCPYVGAVGIELDACKPAPNLVPPPAPAPNVAPAAPNVAPLRDASAP